MTLSARFIRAARIWHHCNECRKIISAGKPYMRLYGMADAEKPWTLRYCLGCTIAEVAPVERHRRPSDVKLIAAIDAAEIWYKAALASNRNK